MMYASDGAHATQAPATISPNVAVGAQSDAFWLLASRCLAPVLVAAALRLPLDSGITLDEAVHKRYGEEILAWFTSGFSDDLPPNLHRDDA